MADVIKVVKGDEKPDVTLSLTDDVSGSVIDLSAGSTVVTIKFRLAGSTTTLSTISTTKLGGGTGGQVSFNFGSGILDVDPGMYEGQIQVSFNGSIQTAFDSLKFRFAEELADS